MAIKKLTEKIRNNGVKAIFLPCGRWLGKGEETTVTGPEARLLVKTNKDIVIVEEQKRKKQ